METIKQTIYNSLLELTWAISIERETGLIFDKLYTDDKIKQLEEQLEKLLYK